MNDASGIKGGDAPSYAAPAIEHDAAAPLPRTQKDKSSRRRTIKTASFSLAGLVALAGAIGGGVMRHDHHVASVHRAEAARAKAKAAKKARADIEGCRKQLGDLVGDLRGIDSALNGSGMTYSAYSTAVNQAEEAQGRVDDYEFSELCQSAFTDAKKAVAYYGTVSSDWNDCITNEYMTDCSAGDAFDISGWDLAVPVIARANDEMNGRTTGTMS